MKKVLIVICMIFLFSTAYSEIHDWKNWHSRWGSEYKSKPVSSDLHPEDQLLEMINQFPLRFRNVASVKIIESHSPIQNGFSDSEHYFVERNFGTRRFLTTISNLKPGEIWWDNNSKTTILGGDVVMWGVYWDQPTGLLVICVKYLRNGKWSSPSDDMFPSPASYLLDDQRAKFMEYRDQVKAEYQKGIRDKKLKAEAAQKAANDRDEVKRIVPDFSLLKQRDINRYLSPSEKSDLDKLMQIFNESSSSIFVKAYKKSLEFEDTPEFSEKVQASKSFELFPVTFQDTTAVFKYELNSNGLVKSWIYKDSKTGKVHRKVKMEYVNPEKYVPVKPIKSGE